MGFWSINPYIGCAFGCAYCYARYAHRYVMERAATDEKMTDALGEAYNRLPPWLAFERNIFVKEQRARGSESDSAVWKRPPPQAARGRVDRDRHRHRSVPARRAKISGHAWNSGGARRASRIERRDHHQEPAHHARHRRALAHQSDLAISRFTSR